MNWEIFMQLAFKIFPGICLGVIILFLLPRKNIEFRFLIYMFFFLLVRDSMTPLGIWVIGPIFCTAMDQSMKPEHTPMS